MLYSETLSLFPKKKKEGKKKEKSSWAIPFVHEDQRKQRHLSQLRSLRLQRYTTEELNKKVTQANVGPTLLVHVSVGCGRHARIATLTKKKEVKQQRPKGFTELTYFALTGCLIHPVWFILG